MVVPAVDVGREGVLAGVAARAVAAVVAEGDGLGEGHVQPEAARHRRGHLGHLQRVGEAGALVVVGEDEHLGLAGQPAEGAGVQDAVAVALEAGAVGIGRLLDEAIAGPFGPGGQRRQRSGLATLTVGPVDDGGASRGRPRSRGERAGATIRAGGRPWWRPTARPDRSRTAG